MSDEKKPTDDLREGLELLFRAARGAVREVAKEVDLSKAARTAGQVVESASKEFQRVANLFGQTFEREIAGKSSEEPKGPAGEAKEEPAKLEEPTEAPADGGEEAAPPSDEKG